MNEYPIEGLMNTAMNSIKEMIDVNTIIGEPIETSNNVVVIPVSKVNFGFAAGGSEFTGKIEKKSINKNEKIESMPLEKLRMPFGGGSGAGVSINPIAFIVVQSTGVKLLPIEHSSSLDKLLDLIPDFVDRINQIIDRQAKKIEKKNGIDFKFKYKNGKVNGNTSKNGNERGSESANGNINGNANSSENVNINGNANDNLNDIQGIDQNIEQYDYEFDETTDM